MSCSYDCPYCLEACSVGNIIEDAVGRPWHAACAETVLASTPARVSLVSSRREQLTLPLEVVDE